MGASAATDVRTRIGAWLDRGAEGGGAAPGPVAYAPGYETNAAGYLIALPIVPMGIGR